MTFRRLGAERKYQHVRVTPQLARIIALRLSGLTPAEIAAQLGLARSSVYTRLCMAGVTGAALRRAIATAVRNHPDQPTLESQ
jgi:hypothetical protein